MSTIRAHLNLVYLVRTMPAVAVLESPFGKLHIYDSSALSTIVSLLRVAAPAPEVEFEGFSAKDWAQYAKRKAAIASKVCKQNGELKARLSAASEDEGEHHFITKKIDPDLGSEADPWASQKLPPSKYTRGASDQTDLWVS